MATDDLQQKYSDSAVLFLFFATLAWGIIGMSAGVLLAAQLIFPELSFQIPEITFGRLRPFHTNCVVFGFGGSALIATAYFSVQRTCHVRLFSPSLAMVVAILWQVGVAVGVVSLLLGYTTGKEYAEFEWPIDIAVALVWILFGVVFFGTIATRKVRPIYISNWFYAALIIVIAMLHVVNSMEIPSSLTKSYSLYFGAQDAIVQWWYGHNAVGFFLTAGFLGMLYYVLPKQVNRPIWSYRLSVIAFWAFVYTYIWAGPHHLHYNAIPDWLQTLGMVMSIILLAPSWATLVNGVMTMRGAWQKLSTNPEIKFTVVSMVFYALATFEGPMLALKTVNVISHFTNWTVGHVHSGALGWNAFIIFGALYFLIPRVLGTELYSKRLVNIHFWIALSGVLLYILAMWGAGVSQGIMWLSIDQFGELKYSFLESLIVTFPYHFIRLIGGLLFYCGLLIMSWNLYKTYSNSKRSCKESIIPPVDLAHAR